MRRFALCLLSCAALFAGSPAQCDDLGVIGQTYDITERDLIEVLKSRLTAMQNSGELAEYQNQYKQKIINEIEHPKPIPGISATATASVHYFDPSMTTERDITDGAGKVLFPRGTHVNPLDYLGWNKYLLFADGRDPKQLAFCKKLIDASDHPVKLVLIAGEPLGLMRKWKIQVYYDQGGVLTKRFAITQVPAIVRQEGKRLRIDELRY